jgi:HSP20 family protein
MDTSWRVLVKMANRLPRSAENPSILADLAWHRRCNAPRPIRGLGPDENSNRKEEGMASNGDTNGSPMLDFELLNNRLSTLFAGGAHPASAGEWAPAASVQETTDGLLVTVELPGTSREDIDIEMENGTLVVKGSKREGTSEVGRYHLRERAHGAFRRAFRLPSWVENDRISARLENGVLSIRLPKAAAAQPRRIEIGRDPQAA